MNRIISEENLNNIFNNEGVESHRILNAKNVLDETTIYIGNEVNQLVSFIKTNNIKSIFYYYSYYNIFDYLINPSEGDEELQEVVNRCIWNNYRNSICIEKEILEVIKKDVEVHDSTINTIDFERPKKLYVFCLFEGHKIAIWDEDYWAEDNIFIFEQMDALDSILEKHKEIIDKKIRNINQLNKAKSESDKDEFKQYLLNSDFKYCTSRELRKDFIINLFEKEEAEKYKELFNYTKQSQYSNVRYFVEELWREYKHNKGIK